MIEAQLLEFTKTIRCLEETQILLIRFLESIDNEFYQRKIKCLQDASVGQHTRHIFEFYHKLTDSIETNKIFYDDRMRNEALELNKNLIINLFNEKMDTLKEVLTNFNLKLQYLILQNGKFIIQEINSNFLRECLFVLDHSIHHMAIIKLGILSENPDFQFPINFGYAFSTLQFNSKKN